MKGNTSKWAIETQRLTRYFGSRCVVDGLNLAVPRGSVYAFLGRNGSGKTTTLRMVLGLIRSTSGCSQVFGVPSEALDASVRSRIGYLTEEHQVHPWMTVRENGKFAASFYPHWNEKIFNEIVEYFRLKEDAVAKHLSRGERAGLALAITLAPEPELLIMDDPALGLDPVARRALVEAMLFVARGKDRTILFSTHTIGDVERVADHLAILDHSRLRVQSSVDTFRERVRRYECLLPQPEISLKKIPGLLRAVKEGNRLRLTCVERELSTQRHLLQIGCTGVEDVPLSLEEAVIDYLSERGEVLGFLGKMNHVKPSEVNYETHVS